jgi:hypothetical protein
VPVTQPDKAGVALSAYERGLPLALFGLAADAHYHTWGIVGGTTSTGDKTSVVWASDSNGYDYIGAFEDYIADRTTAEYVLWANEPDREDQADMSIQEVAVMFLELAAICPDCRFVGPMYSASDDGRKVAAVWERVAELCGSPCPAMDALYAHSLHIYPRQNLNTLPSERVTALCELVDGGECLRPVWVTEFGWLDCFGNVRQGFGEWLEDANADSRIKRYYVYTTYRQPSDNDCPFSALLDWGAWPDYRLRPMGVAFRG